MKTSTILKLNILNKGYSYISTSDDLIYPLYSLYSLDNFLPAIEKTRESPISYSIKRLNDRHIAITLGIYWKDKKDEFGRKGLSYWHMEICQLEGKDESELFLLSEILLKLLTKYQSTFSTFGNFIEIAANEKNNEVLIAAQKITDSFFELDSLSKEIIKFLLTKQSEFPSKSNIRTAFPFDQRLEAIALITLLYGNTDIRSVSGGDLAQPIQLDNEFISTSNIITNFTPFEVNNLLFTGINFKNKSRKITFRYFLYLLFFMITILILFFYGSSIFRVFIEVVKKFSFRLY